MPYPRRRLAILQAVFLLSTIVVPHAQSGRAPDKKVNVPAGAMVTMLRQQQLRTGAEAADGPLRIALGAALQRPVAAGDAGLTAAQQEFDISFGPPPMVLGPNTLTLPSALGPATLRRDATETQITYADATVTVRRGSINPDNFFIRPADSRGAGTTPGAPLDPSRLLIDHGDGNVSIGAPNGTWTINSDPDLPVVFTGFNGTQWAIGGNPPPGASTAGLPFDPDAGHGLFDPGSTTRFATVGGGAGLVPADVVAKSDFGREFMAAERDLDRRFSDLPVSRRSLASNEQVDEWTIEGVNISDAAAIGSSPTYYDFGAIEEVQVTTGGNDALQMTGGVGINIVTKRGSNDVHGSGGGFFTNDSPVNQPPLPAPKVDQILEFGGEAGGPVIKDRLWFWGSANRNKIEEPAPNGSADRTELINYGGKLSGQVVDGSEANLFYHFGDKRKEGRKRDTDTDADAPPAFDLGSGPFGGDPSGCCTPGVQIMTLDFGDPATVPGAPQTRQDVASHSPLLWLAQRMAGGLPLSARRNEAGGAAAVLSFANHPIGMPPNLWRDTVTGRAQASVTPALTTILQANGSSQGEAFEMTVVNNGRTPLKVLGTGVVIEPVKRELQNRLRQQLGKIIPGPNMVKRNVEAYCLQPALAPPAPGMLFQIAGAARQAQFKPAGLIMTAARRLAADGTLHPDSNPARYLDSIKQYAIWTKFENWDMKKFGEALLEKTKQAATAAKADWNGQMQSAVMAAVPNRWRDIQAVLAAARN